MIARYNASQNLTYVNKNYCSFFSLDENACLGQSLTAHFPAEVVLKFADGLKRLTPLKPSFELETSLMVGGQLYWLKWIARIIYLDGEKDKEYQLVGVDFTPLKEAEIKLRVQNVKLDAIFNNSMTGIGVLNKAGDFVFVNSRMVDLLGFTKKEEITGHNFKNYLIEESEESGQSYLVPIFERVQPFLNAVSLVKRGDGFSFWGNWYFGPLVDVDGKVVEVVAIMTDFTSRQELEQRLRDNEDRLLKLNSTKDRFFSIIAHDIKNPFSAIIGLTSVLQDSLDSFTQEEVKVFIDQIAEAGEKTFKLLDDLLTWSRMQLGQLYFNPVLANPGLMATRVMDQLMIVALRKGILLQNKVNPSLKLFLDIPMMEVAIRNGLHNAIKFTEPGGQIEILSDTNDDRFPGKAVISIIDTGVGMTPDVVQALFDLDKTSTTLGTSKEIGTGLGLTLSKEMVEKNLGTIVVFSEPGKGTEFAMVFDIPESHD
jgi:PAS domain S-box-containing protein